MAKSDLLKEAIADAKAVKETALANAKLALQEAFSGRMKGMLEAQLMNELEGEDEMEAGAEDMDMGAGEMEAGAEDMDMEAGETGEMPDSLGIGIDYDNDGSYDYEGALNLGGMEDEAEMDSTEEMPAEDEYAAEEEDLNLESIIAELEHGMDSADEGMYKTEGHYGKRDEGMYEEEEIEPTVTEDIDALIEAILAEESEEDMGAPVDPVEDEMPVEEGDYKKMVKELDEAYRTVKHLQSVINEVNLLNAKLLYTNKLFRNFELNEAQKMKVIENFDRAATTREAKLVFATLAESFHKPTKTRKVVKESKSYASRPIASTAPRTQILNEGFEYADRWKKLAGLI
jgi:hypothetical protein